MTVRALVVMVAALVPTVVQADPLGPFGLEEAVAYALQHHPAVRAETAAEAARRADVAVARAGYLPELDGSVQINAGTGNVLRGPLFSMPNIPAVSGPPTGRSLTDAGWGMLVGVGASWDALGLVDEMARVDAALATDAQARATVAVQRLDVAWAAADQFIDVLAQHERVRAAQASLDRARVFASIVQTLVDQQLRPGADASRAQAELALATTQLIRAQQAEGTSRVALARALGAAGRTIAVAPGALLAPPSDAAPPRPVTHPLVTEARAAVAAAGARRRAVQFQYLPRLDLVASLWIRGSGLASGTLPPSPASGLSPDTPNWSAGVVLTWPALEAVSVYARARAARAELDVARAHEDDIAQAVRAQIDTARQVLESARRVAATTPTALQAARAADTQATARYRAGLATVVDVAEAERLLAEAEAEDAVARLDVRRAELLLARAVGDLGPFFAAARAGGR